MSFQSFNLTSYHVPLDKDGYVVSFDVNDTHGIQTFFNYHGLVAIHNVLNEQECDKTVDEIWDFLKQFNPQIDRNLPSSWDKGWPSFKQFGILGNERFVSPQACENRQNINVYNSFKTIFQTPFLWTNITRAGLMRPTKDILWDVASNTYCDKPEWKTISEWLHLDMNPLTGRCTTYGFQSRKESHFEPSARDTYHLGSNNALRTLKVQGIIALSDCPEQVGGFHCVPGFHHVIEEWALQNVDICEQSNLSGDPTTVQIPKDQISIHRSIQRIPIRKGTLLVWNSCLPHGNFPNDSDQPRIVQYLHMAPVYDQAIAPLNMDELETTWRPVTDLGKKIYGLKPWMSNRVVQTVEQDCCKCNVQ